MIKLFDLAVVVLIAGFAVHDMVSASVAILAAYLVGRYHDRIW